tara:strand:+ start:2404 stop:3312 length:909 start_codon:yes stop_codon:yes gene_type:complete
MAYGTIKADIIAYSDGLNPDKTANLSDLVDAAPKTSPEFVTDITLKAQAPVKFEDDTGGEYVGLKAPAGVTTYTVSLPAGAPTTGQVLKASSASALEWGTDTALTLLDEDDFATDSATAAASQQSVKAYVDTKADILDPVFTGNISFEGSTVNGTTTTIAVIDPTLDRTITLPNASGSVALLESGQNWTGRQYQTFETITVNTGVTPHQVEVLAADNNNFQVTLTAASELINPNAMAPGQSGSIVVIQDGTGGHTLSAAAHWKWAGGTGIPNIATGANEVSRIDYYAATPNQVHATVSAGMA